MAERQGWTMAVRRCGLRWFKLTRGQASVDAGEPSALANGAGGGLWRRGHDDGVHGGALVSIGMALTLTELEWRAREEAAGRWGTSGGVAGVEKQRGRAGVGYGNGGAARARRLLLRGRKAEATRKRSAAECGRALA